ncbi:helix-turn-helix domain-containing protein [Thalassospira povalilytica]|uniref:helix-turn-helix domain-containing protein n=1 Tax=Thalassospira povalilytica TaxID=732237 RepID=UPI00396A652B|nr:helix-turn-helix domain-containing protein [Thalassospira povalilytica]
MTSAPLSKVIAKAPQAARLYELLVRWATPTRSVVASQPRLAAELGVNVRTVMRLTATLEELGVIAKRTVGRGVYAYTLTPPGVVDDKSFTASVYLESDE